MKRLEGLTLSLMVALSGALFSVSAQAQDSNSYLYIAHAAPGRAVATPTLPISTANPALPVDVSVDGNCIAHGLSYGEIGGPYSGPAGTYSFQFTMANSALPCTGQSLFGATVSLSPGTAYFGVLYVDASSAINGLLFQTDLSPIGSGFARVEVVNTTEETLNASVTNGSGTGTISIAPLSLQEGTVLVGSYQASITSGATTFVGPTSIEVTSRDTSLWVISGSAAKQTVLLIGPKTIHGVF